MESQIEKLKQKYWEGETSVEEERILKEHLKEADSNDLGKVYFSEIKNLKSIESNIQFTIPKTKKNIIWKLSSMAATIAILIALAIGFNNYEEPNNFAVEDPQEAYEISRQALLLVSSKLNRGKDYSTRIGKINEVKKTINK